MRRLDPRVSRGTGRLLPILLLPLLLQPAATVRAQPRGRIVWTESTDGSRFSLKTTVYGPDGQPVRNSDEIDAPGATVKVDSEGMIARNGTALEGSGSAAELHKAEVHLLHPALDFTGRRLLFASGTTWGPEQMPPARQAGTASTLSQVSGGTQIRYRFPDRAVSDPSGAQGAGNDAFPASDSQGQYFYFSRFFYGPGEVDLPGWYLMRVEREAAEDASGSAPGAEFVESQSGKVRGSQPFVSPSGEYLLFVRRDHRNAGTDLWYLQLPAEDHSPEKLFEAEGSRDFQLPQAQGGTTREAYEEYSERLAEARISHPVMDASTRFVVYACDRGQGWTRGTVEPATWDLYSLAIERAGDGSLTADPEDQPIEGAATPDADEMWPSLSGDGRWVVYMTQPNPLAGGGGAPGGGGPEIKMAGVEAGEGPRGEVRPVDGARPGAMWPAWDQDEDPPHLLVMLKASDGTAPMTLRILDRDPDPSARSDVFDMSLEWTNYNPRIPPPPQDAPSGYEPLEFKEGGAEEPLALEYRTEESNSLKLLLHGETEELGEHVGLSKLYVPTGNPGETSDQAFTQDVLTGEKLQGLVLYESVRLEVQVFARDNRWRRVGPSGPRASLYSDDPVEEARQIFPEDPRAVSRGTGEAEAPYLDTIGKEDNMDRGKPGISWWVEEGPQGASSDADLEEARPSFENSPYVLFRSPNYPKDDSKPADDPRNVDRYLRIVARDLLSNTVDLRVPILVMPKDFSVNTLESGTQRASSMGGGGDR